MKAIRNTVALLFCAASLTFSANAQTRPAGATPAPAQPAPAAPRPVSNEPVPVSKIALVDTRYFYEEKGGISKLVVGYAQLNREFQPKQQELENLQNRIRAIAEELQKLGNSTVPVDPKTIQNKQDEGERLQRELEYKKKDAEAAYQKRRADIVGPISDEIGKALQAFAQARGITMILDPSQMEAAFLAIIPAVDATQAFIADFNSKNPVAAATAPR
jgi:Skp family chaperone for outer membrane proteins